MAQGFDARVREIIEQYLSDPLALPSEFRGWLAKAPEVYGPTIHSEHVVGVTDKYRYNLRDFGCRLDGRTDDSTKAQSAIDEAIGTGGTVFIPDGTLYLGSAPLDFSGAQGQRRGVLLVGAGTGEGTSNFDGGTIILNGTDGPAIKAYGQQTPSQQEIFGLTFADFAVKNTLDLAAGEATIDFDMVSGLLDVENVYLYGNQLAGDGFRFRNMAQGQSTIRNMKTRGFWTGTGIKVAAEATDVVGTPFNSGNISFIGCLAMDCTKGWHIRNASALINGLSLISCKAVNSVSVVGEVASSIGLYLESGQANFFSAFHSEGFQTGVQLDTARFNIFESLLVSAGGWASSVANAKALHLAASGTGCWGNVVNGLRTQSNASAIYAYGCYFDTNAKTNFVRGSDVTGGRILTANFNDASTDGTNVFVKDEDAASFSSVTPLWNFGNYNLAAKRYRVGAAGAPFLYSGSGTPEAAVAAPIGSIFLRSDGGAGTSFYVKQSGTGNTGWVGK